MTYSCFCNPFLSYVPYAPFGKHHTNFMGPHHFPETSSFFCRNVVLSNRCLAERKTSPNVILPNHHVAESSNYRSFIMSNDIFPIRRIAERHFSEILFSRKSFFQNYLEPNVISPNTI